MSQAEVQPLSTDSIKSGKVLPKANVTVYGTGANRFMPAGVAKTVHKSLAEKLIESGAATSEKPAEKAKKEATK